MGDLPQLKAFPITAHAVTLNVLTYLIDEADRGTDSALLAYLQPEELDTLRNLPLRDILRLTDQNRPLLHISIDSAQLRLCLARVRLREDMEADRMWFIRRGTPHVLMEELYGTPIREFRELRRIAGMSTRPGRPRVLAGTGPACPQVLASAGKSHAASESLSPPGGGLHRGLDRLALCRAPRRARLSEEWP